MNIHWKTDAEAKTPVLCPPDVKNWLIGNDPDSGKDWRQEERGTREDEMVGWDHWLDGHEFEQAAGVGDGQGGAVHLVTKSLIQLNRTEVMLTERNFLSLDLIRTHNQKIHKRYCHCSREENPGLSEQGTVCNLGSWALLETILIGSLQNFLFVHFWLSKRPPNNSADEEKLTSVKAISKHRKLTHRAKYFKLRNNSVHHTFHWSGSHLNSSSNLLLAHTSL